MQNTSLFKVTFKAWKVALFKAEKLAEKLAESEVQSADVAAMKAVVIFEDSTVR